MTNFEYFFETYASYKNATSLFIKWLKDVLGVSWHENKATLSVLDEWVQRVVTLSSCSQKTLGQGVKFIRKARDLRMQGELSWLTYFI